MQQLVKHMSGMGAVGHGSGVASWIHTMLACTSSTPNSNALHSVRWPVSSDAEVLRGRPGRNGRAARRGALAGEGAGNVGSPLGGDIS